ncbi:MAG: glycosyltransferase [Chloroflexota bacterium]|nr:glycosyltransferase [Chloroflexota bacterium]
MKVVFISLFEQGEGGGEGRVAHELASHFSKHHDVVMLCPADETGLFKEEHSDLRVFGVRSAGDGEFRMPALSARTVRATFDFLDEFNPDIVHAHEPALMGLIGQIWAKMNMVPFVHTSHVLPARALDFGATDVLDMKLLQGSFSHSISRRILMDFYENCDAIVALNEPAREALRQFGYNGRLFLIPNGRDLRRYAACVSAETDTVEKNLSFIGYISERKNQVYLIDAHSHLPEQYVLTLIGKALKPEYEKQLKRHCEAQGLDNVVFTGQVPHEEIPSYLEKTHVFVSASKMEVQSLVVIEALASGTPVVGLSNETIDELVDDAVGCRVPKDAPPQEFAARVEHICTLPQPEYESLSESARRRVDHLDWSNVVDQTVLAYRELMEGKPSVTRQEGAVLVDIISFLPSGEVKEILKDRIGATQRGPGTATRFITELSLGRKWRALKRVPGSTWLLAGATIVVSLVGYLFMKGRGRPHD